MPLDVRDWVYGRQRSYIGAQSVAPDVVEQRTAVLITLFAPDNVHLLEIAGVWAALSKANCRAPTDCPYRVRLITQHGLPVRSASGVTFIPDAGTEQATELSTG